MELSRYLWCAAALPPVVLLLYIYRTDRVEREPWPLLGKLFLGGALSVLPAVALEYAGLWLADLTLPRGSVLYTAFCCFLVVGVAEEGGKLFFLRRISWRHPAFNYRFDAIVYAVFVSMGFALVENLVYVFGDGTISTALLRGLTAIPGHAAFSIFMGLYYGSARLYDAAAGRCTLPEQAENCRGQARRYLKRAFWIPVLLHGFYDFCLEASIPWMNAAFTAFVLILDIQAFHQVRAAERQDTPI